MAGSIYLGKLKLNILPHSFFIKKKDEQKQVLGNVLQLPPLALEILGSSNHHPCSIVWAEDLFQIFRISF